MKKHINNDVRRNIIKTYPTLFAVMATPKIGNSRNSKGYQIGIYTTAEEARNSMPRGISVCGMSWTFLIEEVDTKSLNYNRLEQLNKHKEKKENV